MTTGNLPHRIWKMMNQIIAYTAIARDASVNKSIKTIANTHVVNT